MYTLVPFGHEEDPVMSLVPTAKEAISQYIQNITMFGVNNETYDFKVMHFNEELALECVGKVTLRKENDRATVDNYMIDSAHMNKFEEVK